MGGCCIGDCGFCCVVDLCCIGDSCSNCCVGDHPSSSLRSSTEKIIDISQELSELISKNEKEWLKDEKILSREIFSEIDFLIEDLNKINTVEYGSINNRKTLHLNTDLIKQKRDEIEKNVTGFLSREVKGKLVLTDPELTQILKNKNDEKRNSAFKDFQERAMNNAKEDLATYIGNELQLLRDMIRTMIEKNIKEVNEEMKNTEKELKEMRDNKNRNESVVLEKRLRNMYESSVLQITQDIIDEN